MNGVAFLMGADCGLTVEFWPAQWRGGRVSAWGSALIGDVGWTPGVA